MKIAYVARSIIPSQSANSIHVMKICEQFSELCNDFMVIVPKCNIKSDDEAFQFYGIKNKFMIYRIKSGSGLVSSYFFALRAIRKIISQKCEQVVTREPLVAFLAVLIHKKVVLDLHGEIAHQCGRAYRMIKWDFFKKSKYLHLVMITKALVQHHQNKYFLEPELVTILPNGCNLERFAECDKKLLLDSEVIQIAYAGSLGVGRGYEVIEELARRDKKNIYNIYGGTKDDAQKLTGQQPPENIVFHGYVANQDMPKELCKQDILLLPYQNKVMAKGEDSGKFMCPIKMFEYLASGRVIIASNLDILKETLTDDNCYFANPTEVDEWEKIIKNISDNREEARNKAMQAFRDARQHTWRMRAERILELLGEE